MTAVRVGFSLFLSTFMARLVQMTLVEHRGDLWWTLEVLRWGLHITCALIMMSVFSKLFQDLARQRERLAKIEESARWAALELDVAESRKYAEVV